MANDVNTEYEPMAEWDFSSGYGLIILIQLIFRLFRN